MAPPRPRSHRDRLVNSWQRLRQREIEIIRHGIIDQDSCAVTAKTLGKLVEPHHKRILAYQDCCDRSLVIGFRGAGKSAVGTGARAVHHIARDRNIRIGLVSNSITSSSGMLGEVKQHLQTNRLLIDAFGEFVGDKWDAESIKVSGRTKVMKEPTITCMGPESAIATGPHYEILIIDDLVTEENSRTEGKRNKIMNFFYKTVMPCLEPGGKVYVMGTRYNPLDIYGHLEDKDEDYQESVLIIPALDSNEKATWPGKFTTKELKKMRRNMGPIIFGTQYQGSVQEMKGKVFKYEWFRHWDKLPEGLRIYMGVDLAISQKDTADFFAIVVIGVDPKTKEIFLLGYLEDRLTFPDQLNAIKDWFERWDPIKVIIESNAYQAANWQMLRLRPEYKHIRARPQWTDKDKMTRAMKLQVYFQNRQVLIHPNHDKFLHRMLLFPDDKKDLFDAFDIAVSGAFGRGGSRSRNAEDEPGVL